MKKIWKIGLLFGITTLSAAVIIPPVVIIETSNNKVNSSSTSLLSNSDSNQDELINKLSDKWINDNKNTQFIETLFSQITSTNSSTRNAVLFTVIRIPLMPIKKLIIKI